MSKKTVLALLILTMFFWAINFHVVKIALKYYSPMGVAAIRFLFAVVVLFIVMKVIGESKKLSFRRSYREWWYIFLTSFFGIFLTIYFFNKGLKTTSAINSSLIIATNPAVTALFAYFLLNKKLRPIQWGAIFISFFGVVIILVNGDLSQLTHLRVGEGDFYILLMSVVFSLSQIIVAKYIPYIDSIFLTTIASLVALILFVGSSFSELVTTPVPTEFPFWSSILFMGIFGTGIGYTAFYLSVAQLGASKSALYMNLIPFFAVLTASPFGEPIYASQLVGGVVIITGLLIFGISKNIIGSIENT